MATDKQMLSKIASLTDFIKVNEQMAKSTFDSSMCIESVKDLRRMFRTMTIVANNLFDLVSHKWIGWSHEVAAGVIECDEVVERDFQNAFTAWLSFGEFLTNAANLFLQAGISLAKNLSLAGVRSRIERTRSRLARWSKPEFTLSFADKDSLTMVRSILSGNAPERPEEMRALAKKIANSPKNNNANMEAWADQLAKNLTAPQD